MAANQIGSGLSVSPHNADGANADLAMLSLPKVRIGDDVVAQERLLTGGGRIVRHLLGRRAVRVR